MRLSSPLLVSGCLCWPLVEQKASRTESPWDFFPLTIQPRICGLFTSDLELRTSHPPELTVDGIDFFDQRDQDGVADPLQTQMFHCSNDACAVLEKPPWILLSAHRKRQDCSHFSAWLSSYRYGPLRHDWLWFWPTPSFRKINIQHG